MNFIHRFLESMKLPTSTKPTSGFHICDILELNKDQQQKNKNDDEVKSKIDENCDEDELEVKTENLSCESDENVMIKKSANKLSQSSASPTIEQEPKSPLEITQDIKDLKKLKKHLKRDEERSKLEASSGHHQLLSETIHQYPHLFQNHPAMRPWFNSNGKFHPRMLKSSR